MGKISSSDILALVRQYLIEVGLPKLAKKVEKASGENLTLRKNLFGDKKLRKICKFYLKHHPNLLTQQQSESEEEEAPKTKTDLSKRKRSESREEPELAVEKKSKAKAEPETKKPVLLNMVNFVKSGATAVQPKKVEKKIETESEESEEEESEESEKDNKKKVATQAKPSSQPVTVKKTLAAPTKKMEVESEEEEEEEEEESDEEEARPSFGGGKNATVQNKPVVNSTKQTESTQVKQTTSDAVLVNKNESYNGIKQSFNKADYSRFSNLREELKDYSFEAKFKFGTGDEFGKIGYEKLKDTRGNNFRKEKNKLKNKNFQGSGFKITTAVNSIKLS